MTQYTRFSKIELAISKKLDKIVNRHPGLDCDVIRRGGGETLPEIMIYKNEFDCVYRGNSFAAALQKLGRLGVSHCVPAWTGVDKTQFAEFLVICRKYDQQMQEKLNKLAAIEVSLESSNQLEIEFA